MQPRSNVHAPFPLPLSSFMLARSQKCCNSSEHSLQPLLPDLGLCYISGCLEVDTSSQQREAQNHRERATFLHSAVCDWNSVGTAASHLGVRPSDLMDALLAKLKASEKDLIFSKEIFSQVVIGNS
jgi:hypothetical protein